MKLPSWIKYDPRFPDEVEICGVHVAREMFDFLRESANNGSEFKLIAAGERAVIQTISRGRVPDPEHPGDSRQE